MRSTDGRASVVEATAASGVQPHGAGRTVWGRGGWRRAWWLAALLALPSPSGACAANPTQCICTQEFRVYGLTVIDEAQRPVSDVSIEVRVVRTRQRLESTYEELPTPGTYWIVDDGMRERFRPGGDEVRVTGSKGSLGFEATFEFAVDDCYCHVQKLAGPDTVVIRPR